MRGENRFGHLKNWNIEMARLHLYIPTYRRIEKQLTIANLPPAWAARTIVVCGPGEVGPLIKEYKNLRISVKAIIAPKVSTISEKRAWILRHAAKVGHERILMLDDDLRFHIRQETSEVYKGFGPHAQSEWADYVKKLPALGRLLQGKLVSAAKLGTMFERMEWMLGKYAHGAISDRFMNHTYGGEFKLNARYTGNFGANVPILLDNCELNRVARSEDWDYTLQLMRAGYSNAIYMWGAHSSPAQQFAPGGLTGERNRKNSMQSLKFLQQEFPNELTVQPDSRTKYGLALRIHWKKTAVLHNCGPIVEKKSNT
jgi:hypothetical protein